MKILILILILGILFLAFVGATSLGIIDEDFTKKVLNISTAKICEMELLNNVLNKKCNKDTPTEININPDSLSILENTKTGVVRIKNE